MATAKARAVARGVHPTGIAPFGYRHANKKANGGNTGPLVPDPETAPLVRELFERRAAGAGPSELSDWLYSLRTPRPRTVASGSATERSRTSCATTSTSALPPPALPFEMNRRTKRS